MAIFTVAGDTKTEIGGAATDDRYVINPVLVTANQQVTITDTGGANIIQLDGGLEIASSSVTANAMQLTLSNGAVITILGADGFSFQTGGDGTTGAGGTTQSFSDFVTTGLGLATVPTGNTPVTGTAVTVVEAGGTTGGPTPPNPNDPLAVYNAAAATAAASLTAAQNAQAAADTAEANVTNLATAQAYLTAAQAAKAAADTAVTDAAAAAAAAAAAQTAAGATADPADDAPAAAAVAAAQTATAAATAVQTAAAAEVVSATAAVGANTPASNANFTDAVGEVVEGGPGNDTFNGVFVTGAKADSTINVGDTLDGKGGSDTLNILTTKNSDDALPAGFSTTGVENIFITNAAGALKSVDASTFSGLQQLWFVNNGENVTASKLTDAQTLGVKGEVDKSTVTGNFGSSKTVNVALDKAKGAVDVVSSDLSDAGTLNISGSSLVDAAGVVQTVTVGGTATANSKTVNVTASDKVKVDITAATVAETLAVKGSGMAELVGLQNTVKSIDASANTGGFKATGVANTQTVTGGTGGDTFTLAGVGGLKAEGVISMGGGKDKVDVAAVGVAKGAKIDLGADDDSIVGTSGIDKDAVIDGGAGNDTLGLNLVGAANVGAFSNFEIFDVVGQNGTFDLDILTAKNTVTEIVGSGPLGGNSTLLNVGAGVGFRATKDMNTATALTLDQKTAGAITVTLDVDTTKTSVGSDDAETKVILEDATSAKAVFTSNNFDAVTTANKNLQTIDLQTKAATTIEINSTGTNSSNVFVLKDSSNSTNPAGNSLLTSIKVTGDAALDATGLTIDNANKLKTVDASAHTGGLTVELADLANGATVSIGSGTDIVKTANTVGDTAATLEKIVGFEKAASKSAADIKVADLIDDVDTLIVGTEATASTDLDISKGVVTFLGTGPTTLDQAIDFVQAAVTTDNHAVVFEYTGNSYAFLATDGTGTAGNDQVVELVGVTGVTEVGINAGGDLYIV